MLLMQREHDNRGRGEGENGVLSDKYVCPKVINFGFFVPVLIEMSKVCYRFERNVLKYDKT